MKYIILIIGLQLINLTTNAQKLFKEKFDICSPTFLLEKDELFITYTKGDSILICDITKELDKKGFVELKGILAAQLIIDTIGNPCLISYDYKFNSFRKPFDIETSLNSLKNWEGFDNNGFIGIIFKVFFKEKEVTFQRLGFSRNTGWKILSEQTFKKPRVPKKK